MKKTQRTRYVVILGAFLWGGHAMALEKTVSVHLVNTDHNNHGIGENIGTITFQDSDKGLIISPHLKGLPAGEHGFHLHEYPSCEAGQKENQWVAGLGAGDHFDPAHTEKHLGPLGQGHLGDLPVLVVNKKGIAQQKVLAPHLTTSEIQGRSLIIHAGGDNYSDIPPLGGGGIRIACGVIQ